MFEVFGGCRPVVGVGGSASRDEDVVWVAGVGNAGVAKERWGATSAVARCRGVRVQAHPDTVVH